jgi:hypothetical protein
MHQPIGNGKQSRGQNSACADEIIPALRSQSCFRKKLLKDSEILRMIPERASELFLAWRSDMA